MSCRESQFLHQPDGGPLTADGSWLLAASAGVYAGDKDRKLSVFALTVEAKK